MQQVKRRVFAGAVCIQDVWQQRAFFPGKIGMPRPRFNTQAERDRFNLMRSRRHHALVINQNYSPNSLYSTLTFCQAEEIHTFSEAKIIRNRFYDVLQYKYPAAKITIYIGRGKSTHRIHFHMLSDGIPEEYIKAKWKYGEIVQIDHLREDNYYNGINHGCDYTALANYLFDHWTPEQGKGKRYKQSKNHAQPCTEKNELCKRLYTENKPPAAPKGYVYIGCTQETQYGFISFKYIKLNQRSDKNVSRDKSRSKARDNIRQPKAD